MIRIVVHKTGAVTLRLGTTTNQKIGPGSGSAQTDADPDPGGNKVWK